MRFPIGERIKCQSGRKSGTLKDVASSNFSSTPLPERNRGNSYRESGLFCQQFNFFNFFDSFFSLRQPSNPHLLAHGASYVPTLCEIKRQTESNRGNQVDYDCPTNKLDLYGRFLERVRRNLPRSSRLPLPRCSIGLGRTPPQRAR